MKIDYAFSFEDFIALAPPDETKAGKNLGFKGLVLFCIAFLGLGLYTFIKGLGPELTAFCVGLSVLTFVGGYFFDRRSISSGRETRLYRLLQAYRKIHCPDKRTFEASDSDFTVRCNCGTVSRPWSELIQVTELPTHFQIGTEKEAHLIPKSAFATAGEMTEFRGLVSGHLASSSNAFSNLRIEFDYRREDYRHAFWLNLLKAGGWKPWLGSLACFVCVLAAGVSIWQATGPSIRAGLVGGGALWIGRAILWFTRKPYIGRIQATCTEDALILRDDDTTFRSSWDHFTGYVENHQVILLYHYHQPTYRVIPKRALRESNSDFAAFLRLKVPAG